MTTLALALSLTIGRLTTAWQQRRATQRAWQQGTDITEGLAAITGEQPRILAPWHDVPPRDTTDPCKDGRKRCRECRLGGDCRDTDTAGRPAYAAGLVLPRPGRHTIPVRIAHWSRIVRLHDLRDQLGIPAATAWRLP